MGALPLTGGIAVLRITAFLPAVFEDGRQRPLTARRSVAQLVQSESSSTSES
jgi:hypothetical protein